MTCEPNREKLLEVHDLHVTFGKHRHAFEAVRGVNFDIYKGETFGLVGESGSGKTTIGRAIIRMNPTSGGEILYKGEKINGRISREMDKKIIKEIQMIFQDPMSSLNDRAKVNYIVKEGLMNVRKHLTREQQDDLVNQALTDVGLLPEFASRFPHEFSGGQRQRIGIARALAVNPEFIVCDEPVSALDVSIQAQVINMFDDLQDKLGLTYLFIAHDLLVVRHISDRIAVMYLGKMVELADAEEIYNHPLHPYSQSLLSAVPLPDPKTARANKRIVLTGDIPSPLNAPSGCPFRTRCRYATEACAQSMPPFEEVEKGHFVACHRVKEIN